MDCPARDGTGGFQSTSVDETRTEIPQEINKNDKQPMPNAPNPVPKTILTICLDDDGNELGKPYLSEEVETKRKAKIKLDELISSAFQNIDKTQKAINRKAIDSDNRFDYTIFRRRYAIQNRSNSEKLLALKRSMLESALEVKKSDNSYISHSPKNLRSYTFKPIATRTEREDIRQSETSNSFLSLPALPAAKTTSATPPILLSIENSSLDRANNLTETDTTNIPVSRCLSLTNFNTKTAPEVSVSSNIHDVVEDLKALLNVSNDIDNFNEKKNEIDKNSNKDTSDEAPVVTSDKNTDDSSDQQPLVVKAELHPTVTILSSAKNLSKQRDLQLLAEKHVPKQLSNDKKDQPYSDAATSATKKCYIEENSSGHNNLIPEPKHKLQILEGVQIFSSDTDLQHGNNEKQKLPNEDNDTEFNIQCSMKFPEHVENSIANEENDEESTSHFADEEKSTNNKKHPSKEDLHVKGSLIKAKDVEESSDKKDYISSLEKQLIKGSEDHLDFCHQLLLAGKGKFENHIIDTEKVAELDETVENLGKKHMHQKDTVQASTNVIPNEGVGVVSLYSDQVVKQDHNEKITQNKEKTIQYDTEEVTEEKGVHSWNREVKDTSPSEDLKQSKTNVATIGSHFDQISKQNDTEEVTKEKDGHSWNREVKDTIPSEDLTHSKTNVATIGSHFDQISKQNDTEEVTEEKDGHSWNKEDTIPSEELTHSKTNVDTIGSHFDPISKQYDTEEVTEEKDGHVIPNEGVGVVSLYSDQVVKQDHNEKITQNKEKTIQYDTEEVTEEKGVHSWNREVKDTSPSEDLKQSKTNVATIGSHFDQISKQNDTEEVTEEKDGHSWNREVKDTIPSEDLTHSKTNVATIGSHFDQISKQNDTEEVTEEKDGHSWNKEDTIPSEELTHSKTNVATIGSHFDPISQQYDTEEVTEEKDGHVIPNEGVGAVSLYSDQVVKQDHNEKITQNKEKTIQYDTEEVTEEKGGHSWNREVKDTSPSEDLKQSKTNVATIRSHFDQISKQNDPEEVTEEKDGHSWNKEVKDTIPSEDLTHSKTNVDTIGSHFDPISKQNDTEEVTEEKDGHSWNKEVKDTTPSEDLKQSKTNVATIGSHFDQISKQNDTEEVTEEKDGHSWNKEVKDTIPSEDLTHSKTNVDTIGSHFDPISKQNDTEEVTEEKDGHSWNREVKDTSPSEDLKQSKTNVATIGSHFDQISKQNDTEEVTEQKDGHSWNREVKDTIPSEDLTHSKTNVATIGSHFDQISKKNDTEKVTEEKDGHSWNKEDTIPSEELTHSKTNVDTIGSHFDPISKQNDTEEVTEEKDGHSWNREVKDTSPSEDLKQSKTNVATIGSHFDQISKQNDTEEVTEEKDGHSWNKEVKDTIPSEDLTHSKTNVDTIGSHFDPISKQNDTEEVTEEKDGHSWTREVKDTSPSEDLKQSKTNVATIGSHFDQISKQNDTEEVTEQKDGHSWNREVKDTIPSEDLTHSKTNVATIGSHFDQISKQNDTEKVTKEKDGHSWNKEDTIPSEELTHSKTNVDTIGSHFDPISKQYDTEEVTEEKDGDVIPNEGVGVVSLYSDQVVKQDHNEKITQNKEKTIQYDTEEVTEEKGGHSWNREVKDTSPSEDLKQSKTNVATIGSHFDQISKQNDTEEVTEEKDGHSWNKEVKDTIPSEDLTHSKTNVATIGLHFDQISKQNDTEEVTEEKDGHSWNKEDTIPSEELTHSKTNVDTIGSHFDPTSKQYDTEEVTEKKDGHIWNREVKDTIPLEDLTHSKMNVATIGSHFDQISKQNDTEEVTDEKDGHIWNREVKDTSPSVDLKQSKTNVATIGSHFDQTSKQNDTEEVTEEKYAHSWNKKVKDTIPSEDLKQSKTNVDTIGSHFYQISKQNDTEEVTEEKDGHSWNREVKDTSPSEDLKQSKTDIDTVGSHFDQTSKPYDSEKETEGNDETLAHILNLEVEEHNDIGVTGPYFHQTSKQNDSDKLAEQKVFSDSAGSNQEIKQTDDIARHAKESNIPNTDDDLKYSTTSIKLDVIQSSSKSITESSGYYNKELQQSPDGGTKKIDSPSLDNIAANNKSDHGQDNNSSDEVLECFNKGLLENNSQCKNNDSITLPGQTSNVNSHDYDLESRCKEKDSPETKDRLNSMATSDENIILNKAADQPLNNCEADIKPLSSEFPLVKEITKADCDEDKLTDSHPFDNEVISDNLEGQNNMCFEAENSMNTDSNIDKSGSEINNLVDETMPSDIVKENTEAIDQNFDTHQKYDSFYVSENLENTFQPLDSATVTIDTCVEQKITDFVVEITEVVIKNVAASDDDNGTENDNGTKAVEYEIPATTAVLPLHLPEPSSKSLEEHINFESGIQANCTFVSEEQSAEAKIQPDPHTTSLYETIQNFSPSELQANDLLTLSIVAGLKQILDAETIANRNEEQRPGRHVLSKSDKSKIKKRERKSVKSKSKERKVEPLKPLESENDEDKRVTRSSSRKSMLDASRDDILDNTVKPQDFKTSLPTKNVEIHQLPDSNPYSNSTDSDSNDSSKLFIDDKKYDIFNEATQEENLSMRYEPRIRSKSPGMTQKTKTPAEKKLYSPYVAIERLPPKNFSLGDTKTQVEPSIASHAIPVSYHQKDLYKNVLIETLCDEGAKYVSAAEQPSLIRGAKNTKGIGAIKVVSKPFKLKRPHQSKGKRLKSKTLENIFNIDSGCNDNMALSSKIEIEENVDVNKPNKFKSPGRFHEVTVTPVAANTPWKTETESKTGETKEIEKLNTPAEKTKFVQRQLRSNSGERCKPKSCDEIKKTKEFDAHDESSDLVEGTIATDVRRQLRFMSCDTSKINNVNESNYETKKTAEDTPRQLRSKSCDRSKAKSQSKFPESENVVILNELPTKACASQENASFKDIKNQSKSKGSERLIHVESTMELSQVKLAENTKLIGTEAVQTRRSSQSNLRGNSTQRKGDSQIDMEAKEEQNKLEPNNSIMERADVHKEIGRQSHISSNSIDQTNEESKPSHNLRSKTKLNEVENTATKLNSNDAKDLADVKLAQKCSSGNSEKVLKDSQSVHQKRRSKSAEKTTLRVPQDVAGDIKTDDSLNVPISSDITVIKVQSTKMLRSKSSDTSKMKQAKIGGIKTAERSEVTELKSGTAVSLDLKSDKKRRSKSSDKTTLRLLQDFADEIKTADSSSIFTEPVEVEVKSTHKSKSSDTLTEFKSGAMTSLEDIKLVEKARTKGTLKEYFEARPLQETLTKTDADEDASSTVDEKRVAKEEKSVQKRRSRSRCSDTKKLHLQEANRSGTANKSFVETSVYDINSIDVKSLQKQVKSKLSNINKDEIKTETASTTGFEDTVHIDPKSKKSTSKRSSIAADNVEKIDDSAVTYAKVISDKANSDLEMSPPVVLQSNVQNTAMNIVIADTLEVPINILPKKLHFKYMKRSKQVLPENMPKNKDEEQGGSSYENSKYTAPPKLRNKRNNSIGSKIVTIDLSKKKNPVKNTAEKLEKRLEIDGQKPEYEMKSSVYAKNFSVPLLVPKPEGELDNENNPLQLRINLENQIVVETCENLNSDEAIDLTKGSKFLVVGNSKQTVSSQNDKPLTLDILSTNNEQEEPNSASCKKKINVLSDITIRPNTQPQSNICTSVEFPRTEIISDTDTQVTPIVSSSNDIDQSNKDQSPNTAPYLFDTEEISQIIDKYTKDNKNMRRKSESSMGNETRNIKGSPRKHIQKLQHTADEDNTENFRFLRSARSKSCAPDPPSVVDYLEENKPERDTSAVSGDVIKNTSKPITSEKPVCTFRRKISKRSRLNYSKTSKPHKSFRNSSFKQPWKKLVIELDDADYQSETEAKSAVNAGDGHMEKDVPDEDKETDLTSMLLKEKHEISDNKTKHVKEVDEKQLEKQQGSIELSNKLTDQTKTEFAVNGSENEINFVNECIVTTSGEAKEDELSLVPKKDKKMVDEDLSHIIKLNIQELKVDIFQKDSEQKSTSIETSVKSLRNRKSEELLEDSESKKPRKNDNSHKTENKHTKTDTVGEDIADENSEKKLEEIERLQEIGKKDISIPLQRSTKLSKKRKNRKPSRRVVGSSNNDTKKGLVNVCIVTCDKGELIVNLNDTSSHVQLITESVVDLPENNDTKKGLINDKSNKTELTNDSKYLFETDKDGLVEKLEETNLYIKLDVPSETVKVETVCIQEPLVNDENACEDIPIDIVAPKEKCESDDSNMASVKVEELGTNSDKVNINVIPKNEVELTENAVSLNSKKTEPTPLAELEIITRSSDSKDVENVQIHDVTIVQQRQEVKEITNIQGLEEDIECSTENTLLVPNYLQSVDKDGYLTNLNLTSNSKESENQLVESCMSEKLVLSELNIVAHGKKLDMDSGKVENQDPGSFSFINESVITEERPGDYSSKQFPINVDVSNVDSENPGKVKTSDLIKEVGTTVAQKEAKKNAPEKLSATNLSTKSEEVIYEDIANENAEKKMEEIERLQEIGKKYISIPLQRSTKLSKNRKNRKPSRRVVGCSNNDTKKGLINVCVVTSDKDELIVNLNDTSSHVQLRTDSVVDLPENNDTKEGLINDKSNETELTNDSKYLFETDKDGLVEKLEETNLYIKLDVPSETVKVETVCIQEPLVNDENACEDISIDIVAPKEKCESDDSNMASVKVEELGTNSDRVNINVIPKNEVELTENAVSLNSKKTEPTPLAELDITTRSSDSKDVENIQTHDVTIVQQRQDVKEITNIQGLKEDVECSKENTLLVPNNLQSVDKDGYLTNLNLTSNSKESENQLVESCMSENLVLSELNKVAHGKKLDMDSGKVENQDPGSFSFINESVITEERPGDYSSKQFPINVDVSNVDSENPGKVETSDLIKKVGTIVAQKEAEKNAPEKLSAPNLSTKSEEVIYEDIANENSEKKLKEIERLQEIGKKYISIPLQRSTKLSKNRQNRKPSRRVVGCSNNDTKKGLINVYVVTSDKDELIVDLNDTSSHVQLRTDSVVDLPENNDTKEGLINDKSNETELTNDSKYLFETDKDGLVEKLEETNLYIKLDVPSETVKVETVCIQEPLVNDENACEDIPIDIVAPKEKCESDDSNMASVKVEELGTNSDRVNINVIPKNEVELTENAVSLNSKKTEPTPLAELEITTRSSDSKDVKNVQTHDVTIVQQREDVKEITNIKGLEEVIECSTENTLLVPNYLQLVDKDGYLTNLNLTSHSKESENQLVESCMSEKLVLSELNKAAHGKDLDMDSGKVENQDPGSFSFINESVITEERPGDYSSKQFPINVDVSNIDSNNPGKVKTSDLIKKFRGQQENRKNRASKKVGTTVPQKGAEKNVPEILSATNLSTKSEEVLAEAERFTDSCLTTDKPESIKSENDLVEDKCDKVITVFDKMVSSQNVSSNNNVSTDIMGKPIKNDAAANVSTENILHQLEFEINRINSSQNNRTTGDSPEIPLCNDYGNVIDPAVIEYQEVVRESPVPFEEEIIHDNAKLDVAVADLNCGQAQENLIIPRAVTTLEAAAFFPANKSDKIEISLVDDLKINQNSEMKTLDLSNCDPTIGQQIGDIWKKHEEKISQEGAVSKNQIPLKRKMPLGNQKPLCKKCKSNPISQHSDSIISNSKNALIFDNSTVSVGPHEAQVVYTADTTQVVQNHRPCTTAYPGSAPLVVKNKNSVDTVNLNMEGNAEFPDPMPYVDASNTGLCFDMLPNDLTDIFRSILAEKHPNTKSYPQGISIVASHVSTTITHNHNTESNMFSPDDRKNRFATITTKKEIKKIKLNWNNTNNQYSRDPVFNSHGIQTNQNLATEWYHPSAVQRIEHSASDTKLSAITDGTNDHNYSSYTRDPVMSIVGYGTGKEFENIYGMDMDMDNMLDLDIPRETYTNWDSDPKVIVVANEQYNDEFVPTNVIPENIEDTLVNQPWVPADTAVLNSQYIYPKSTDKEIEIPSTPPEENEEVIINSWNSLPNQHNDINVSQAETPSTSTEPWPPTNSTKTAQVSPNDQYFVPVSMSSVSPKSSNWTPAKFERKNEGIMNLLSSFLPVADRTSTESYSIWNNEPKVIVVPNENVTSSIGADHWVPTDSGVSVSDTSTPISNKNMPWYSSEAMNNNDGQQYLVSEGKIQDFETSNVQPEITDEWPTANIEGKTGEGNNLLSFPNNSDPPELVLKPWTEPTSNPQYSKNVVTQADQPYGLMTPAWNLEDSTKISDIPPIYNTLLNNPPSETLSTTNEKNNEPVPYNTQQKVPELWTQMGSNPSNHEQPNSSFYTTPLGPENVSEHWNVPERPNNDVETPSKKNEAPSNSSSKEESGRLKKLLDLHKKMQTSHTEAQKKRAQSDVIPGRQYSNTRPNMWTKSPGIGSPASTPSPKSNSDNEIKDAVACTETNTNTVKKSPDINKPPSETRTDLPQSGAKSKLERHNVNATVIKEQEKVLNTNKIHVVQTKCEPDKSRHVPSKSANKEETRNSPQRKCDSVPVDHDSFTAAGKLPDLRRSPQETLKTSETVFSPKDRSASKSTYGVNDRTEPVKTRKPSRVEDLVPAEVDKKKYSDDWSKRKRSLEKDVIPSGHDAKRRKFETQASADRSKKYAKHGSADSYQNSDHGEFDSPRNSTQKPSKVDSPPPASFEAKSNLFDNVKSRERRAPDFYIAGDSKDNGRKKHPESQKSYETHFERVKSFYPPQNDAAYTSQLENLKLRIKLGSPATGYKKQSSTSHTEYSKSSTNYFNESRSSSNYTGRNISSSRNGNSSRDSRAFERSSSKDPKKSSKAHKKGYKRKSESSDYRGQDETFNRLRGQGNINPNVHLDNQSRPPDPPSGKPSVTASSDSVTVSWDTPPYDGGKIVNGYTVEYAAVGSDTWTTVVEEWHSTSYVVRGLQPGRRYMFRVRALNVHGYSRPSVDSDIVQLEEHSSSKNQRRDYSSTHSTRNRSSSGCYSGYGSQFRSSDGGSYSTTERSSTRGSQQQYSTSRSSSRTGRSHQESRPSSEHPKYSQHAYRDSHFPRKSASSSSTRPTQPAARPMQPTARPTQPTAHSSGHTNTTSSFEKTDEQPMTEEKEKRLLEHLMKCVEVQKKRGNKKGSPDTDWRESVGPLLSHDHLGLGADRNA